MAQKNIHSIILREKIQAIKLRPQFCSVKKSVSVRLVHVEMGGGGEKNGKCSLLFFFANALYSSVFSNFL